MLVPKHERKRTFGEYVRNITEKYFEKRAHALLHSSDRR
jgi:hypothetical protein